MLEWVAQGSAVLLDGRQRFDVASARWTTLPHGITADELSPSGDRLVHVEREAHTFQVTAWDEAPSVEKWLKIPQLISPQSFDDEEEEPYVSSWASWLDEEHLMVVQRGDMARLGCQVYDVAKRSWGAAGCPPMTMSELAAILAGPAGRLAVVSSGEGHPDINLVTWSASGGFIAPQVAMRVELYPVEQVSLSFSNDPERVWLLSPCALDLEGGCRNSPELAADAPQKLHVWSEREGMKRLREDVATGAVYDARHDRFAWRHEGELCVGDPARGEVSCAKILPLEE